MNINKQNAKRKGKYLQNKRWPKNANKTPTICKYTQRTHAAKLAEQVAGQEPEPEAEPEPEQCRQTRIIDVVNRIRRSATGLCSGFASTEERIKETTDYLAVGGLEMAFINPASANKPPTQPRLPGN